MNAPVKADVKSVEKAEPIAPVEAERKVTPILPVRMDAAEFKRTQYTVTAYEHTQPEDLLVPEYWAHVASLLRPWDRIEVRAEDGSWFADYIVLDSSRNCAKVHLLAKYALTTTDVVLSQLSRDKYEISHRGPERKWSVIRKSDRGVLKDEMQTESAAYIWLGEHLKA